MSGRKVVVNGYAKGKAFMALFRNGFTARQCGLRVNVVINLLD